jgi:hypothetical protein
MGKRLVGVYACVVMKQYSGKRSAHPPHLVPFQASHPLRAMAPRAIVRYMDHPGTVLENLAPPCEHVVQRFLEVHR